MSLLSKALGGSYILVRAWDEAVIVPKDAAQSSGFIPATPYLIRAVGGEIFNNDTDEISCFSKNFANKIAQMVVARDWHRNGFDILATRLVRQFNQDLPEVLDYEGQFDFSDLKVELYNLGETVFREGLIEAGRLLPPPMNK